MSVLSRSVGGGHLRCEEERGGGRGLPWRGRDDGAALSLGYRGGKAEGVVVVEAEETNLRRYINMTDGSMLSETCTVSPHCGAHSRLFFLRISCAAIGAAAAGRRSSCHSV